jgi:hypothetical protein
LAVLLLDFPSETRADTGKALVDHGLRLHRVSLRRRPRQLRLHLRSLREPRRVPAGFPGTQYAYATPSTAEAGDLVFFDEHGYGVSHVGIATGCGTMIHSSTYYGTVVQVTIGSVPGYVGAVDVYSNG